MEVDSGSLFFDTVSQVLIMDERLKLSLLIGSSQLNSVDGKQLGTGNMKGILRLARLMVDCGISGNIFDLPNGSQRLEVASPFSLNSGFALKIDEIDCFDIPELDEDLSLKQHVKRISDNFLAGFRDKRVVDYALKRSVMPWVLDECYQLFTKGGKTERHRQFDKFRSVAAYWLDEYVVYELFKEQRLNIGNPVYKDLSSDQINTLMSTNEDRLMSLRYRQFICFEQRQALKSELNRLSVGLIVNLPFGVEPDSADVFFHPEVFDTTLQVGCSPEPEHGYPEQAWGVSVYKERSEGLRTYLREKTRWMSLLGDGVFIDHMVGWCGQYVLPVDIPVDSVYPHGCFLTEIHEERMENARWILNLFFEAGLSVKGEIAGDMKRVKATRQVVDEYRLRGKDVTAMVIPRWEKKSDRITPLSQYQPDTLTMVETHDTSTLLQYLVNKKGYSDDFESPDSILEFCQRGLALPFFRSDVPLSTRRVEPTVWLEISKRLVNGVASKEVVFTLPGLLSLLASDYRSTSIENNINVKPGTSGLVGNGWGNWGYFSPPIEIMGTDPFVRESLRQLGAREHKPFDAFHLYQPEDGDIENLNVIYSRVLNRVVIYRNALKNWCVWDGHPDGVNSPILLEMLIQNYSDQEVWQRIDMTGLIDLDGNHLYSFQDLNGEQGCYTYSSGDLKENRLFVRLAPGQIHHFLIYVNG